MSEFEHEDCALPTDKLMTSYQYPVSAALTREQVESRLYICRVSTSMEDIRDAILEVLAHDSHQRAELARLTGWLTFLKRDDNDDGRWASAGERCVDFYRNCDMALEGKPVPQQALRKAGEVHE